MKSIFSSPGSSVGRALDFQTNVKGFESYVGRNSPFSQNWKQENKNFELTNAVQKKPQWAAKLQES